MASAETLASAQTLGSAESLGSQWLAAEQPDNGAQSGAPSDDKDRAETGTTAAPQTENSPTRSPWWSAPAGRPVAIPAFGRGILFARGLLEVLLDLLMPKPVLVPVKVRATKRRR